MNTQLGKKEGCRESGRSRGRGKHNQGILSKVFLIKNKIKEERISCRAVFYLGDQIVDLYVSQV
ncbi:rCG26428 [Rattus norvegicus]|uniref:RCG26428 n=1 Tax=Rattus norvegicus TaxID=10116 RepID=A6HQJ0_RAT|nr:rCG26428 [Rattus norvegicus]